MKPVVVDSCTHIDFGVKDNGKGPNFKVGDQVRISKYKNVFAKNYNPSLAKEIFVIGKVNRKSKH